MIFSKPFLLNICTWTFRKLFTLVTFETWSVEKSTVHYKPLGIRSPEFTTSILSHEASKKPTVEALLLLLPDWDARHKTQATEGLPSVGERGSGEQGRTRRSANPPTSGTLDCQNSHPLLLGFLPLAPFKKKIKHFCIISPYFSNFPPF